MGSIAARSINERLEKQTEWWEGRAKVNKDVKEGKSGAVTNQYQPLRRRIKEKKEKENNKKKIVENVPPIRCFC